MEVQVTELKNQKRTLGAASRVVALGTEQAKIVGPVASTSKMVPTRTPNPPVTLKMSPKTEPKVLKPPSRKLLRCTYAHPIHSAPCNYHR